MRFVTGAIRSSNVAPSSSSITRVGSLGGRPAVSRGNGSVGVVTRSPLQVGRASEPAGGQRGEQRARGGDPLGDVPGVVADEAEERRAARVHPRQTERV